MQKPHEHRPLTIALHDGWWKAGKAVTNWSRSLISCKNRKILRFIPTWANQRNGWRLNDENISDKFVEAIRLFSPLMKIFAKRILSSSATSRKRRLTVARCIANVVVVVVIDVVVIDVVGVFRDVVGVVLIILWHVGSVSYTSSLKKWSSSNPFWQTLHLSFPLSPSLTHTPFLTSLSLHGRLKILVPE